MDKEKIVYKEIKSPLTAQLELTYSCNHNCIYCYNPWRNDEGSRSYELSLDNFKKIINKLGEADIFELVLTGGEPLLKREKLFQLIDLCHNNNIDTRINTNGELLNKQDIKMIKKLNVGGVLVSLSSYDEKTHNQITQSKSFKKISKTLDLLVENEINTGVSMVLTQLNKNDVFETCRFVYEKGINIFCLTPISPCRHLDVKLNLSRDEIKEALDELLYAKEEFNVFVDTLEPIPRCIFEDPLTYEQFLKRDCSAGRTTIAISPSGDVRPCTHVPKKYGNLVKEDLKNVWKKMKEWRDGSYVPEKCSKCAEVEFCSTGCREAAYSLFGSYNSEDPLIKDIDSLTEKRESIGSRTLYLNKVYSLNRIKYRKEDENYAIYSAKTHSVEIINSDFFNFIKFLAKKKQFSLKEFEDRPIFSNTIKFLNDRGFLNTW